MKTRNRRWGPCPGCGTSGWETGKEKVPPRYDHDTPRGKRCRWAEMQKAFDDMPDAIKGVMELP